ncbi:MAG: phytanoyl-CoA dioxygenase family protein [Phycisphaerales bacterium]|nr:phytanoyl-CoA dioxygenase family protein [Phycisphaerales bacterium]
MGASLRLETDGCELISGFVAGALLESLRETAPDGRAGLRDPLRSWQAGRHAARVASDLATRTLSSPAILTRAILFDKRAAANWHLAMHQDVTVAVAARHEVEGFGPWSLKAGAPHVEPPPAVLAGMLTVRIHLDDARVADGCLRVVPGSHMRGRLRPGAYDPSPATGLAIEASAGDALLMRPLLLHGSQRSSSGRRRRILHLEFASAALPRPLEWFGIEIRDDPATRSA